MEPVEPESRTRGLRRLVVLLAAVVAVAGVALVLRSTLRPSRAPAPVVQGGEPGENDVERALRLAGIDSTKKNEWVEDVPGADLSRLPARGRELFVRFANAERCTCGCGFTLAACRRFDSTCEVSGPRVEALIDSIARGRVTDASGLRERPREAGR